MQKRLLDIFTLKYGNLY